jgi:ribosome maturation protein Sdo1
VPALGLPLFYGPSESWRGAYETVKTGCLRADTHPMIISEQQVQRVLEYLHSHDGLVAERVAMDHNVSPELVERIRVELERFPEMRDDRVAIGRELVASHEVNSDEVAAKMIGRIISDSMR